MDVVTLPEYFGFSEQSKINLVLYKSTQDVSKQQVHLKTHVFSFLSEGEKTVVGSHSSFKINSTEFLLMQSGHCLMTEKRSPEKNYKSTLLFFSDEHIRSFIKKYTLKNDDKSVIRSVIPFQYDPYILQLVEGLKIVATLTETLKEKLLATKLEELFLYLTEKIGVSFLFNLMEYINHHEAHFISVVNSNQLNKLSLKELAFLSNMSVSTFKRMFEKHFSVSPIKWFQEKRLDYAYYLLKHERKRPSDIYFDIGYDNLSSFIQAYKTKFGSTPKQHTLF